MNIKEKIESLYFRLSVTPSESWQDSDEFCKEHSITRMTLHNWIQKGKVYKINIDKKNYVCWNKNYSKINFKTLN